VARTLGDPIHAEIAIGAGNILDHGGHLPPRTQPVGDHAADDILGASRWKTNDELDGQPCKVWRQLLLRRQHRRLRRRAIRRGEADLAGISRNPSTP